MADSPLLSDDDIFGPASPWAGPPSAMAAPQGTLLSDADLFGAPSSSFTDYPVELGKGFLEGGKNTVATSLKGTAALAKGTERRALADIDAIDAGQRMPAINLRGGPSDVMGVQDMAPEERAAARATLQQAVDQPITDTNLYGAGQAIEHFGKETLAPRPGFEGSWTRDIGAGFGSVGAGIVLSILQPHVAQLMWVTSGSGEAVDNAIRAGATPEQIERAAQFGSIPGATDAVDAMLPALGSTGRVGGLIKRVGLGAIKAAFAEGGQEGFQQFLQNVIAQGIYKPDQDLLEDVPRSALIGAIVGGTVGGGTAAAERQARAAPAQALPGDQSAVPAETILPGPGDSGPYTPVGNPPPAVAPAQPQAPAAPNADLPGEGASPFEQAIQGSNAGVSTDGVTDPTAQPQNGPIISAPSNEAAKSDVVSDDAAVLRAYGYTDEQIAGMSPDQQAAELQDAVAAGVVGQPPAPADQIVANNDLNSGSPQQQEVLPPAAAPLDTPVTAQPEPQGVPHGRAVLQKLLNDPRTANEIRADIAAAESWQPTSDWQAAPPGAALADLELRQQDGKTFARIPPPTGSREAPVDLQTPADVHAGAEQTAQPTPGQAKAGNYSKRHVKWNGLDISVETEAGGQRTGISADGAPWSTTLQHPYGYIKRTVGKDGDHVDLYLGPNPASDRVYVFDQVDPVPREFDENKLVIGATDMAQAEAIYNSGFSDGSAPHRIGAVTEMSVPEFKTWLAQGNTKKAIAYTKQRAEPKRKVLSLFEFLAANGGIRDQGGELRSLDLTRHFVPGFGRLVRPSGKPLDSAREAAAEAGYLQDHAHATTTVNDLLTLLRQESAGQRVYSVRDVQAAQEREQQRSQRADKERFEAAQDEVRDIAKQNKAALTDDELREIATLALVDGMDVADAFVEILERGHYAAAQEAVSYDSPQEQHDERQAANASAAADQGRTREPEAGQQPARPAGEAAARAAPNREQSGGAQSDRGQAPNPEGNVAGERATGPGHGGLASQPSADQQQTPSETPQPPPDAKHPGQFDESVKALKAPETGPSDLRPQPVKSAPEAVSSGPKAASKGPEAPSSVQPAKIEKGVPIPSAEKLSSQERQDFIDGAVRRISGIVQGGEAKVRKAVTDGVRDAKLVEIASDVWGVHASSSLDRGTVSGDGKTVTIKGPFDTVTLKGKELAAAIRRAFVVEAAPQQPAPAAPNPERAQSLKPDSIQDFGEKIEGARKDTFAGFRDSLRDKIDVLAEPLSKSFPQPNYEKLAEGGVSKRVLAHIAIMRDMIPNRPRVAWKAKQWAAQVELLRNFARQLLDGEIDVAKMEQAARDNHLLQSLPLTAEAIEDVAPADLPQAAQYRVTSGSYSMLNGKRYSPSKSFWFMTSADSRTLRNPLSNDPAEAYTYRDNPKDAVALAKQIIAHDLQKAPQAETGERSKYTDIGIYRDRSVPNGAFLGFKVRSTVIRLKAGFETPQAAREYLQENRDALQATIDAMRKGPNMRGTENRARTGEALREGDVSPEVFGNTFGFRGVQFGNYVEGPRRQADLNRAFDALMDLADVLDVPPRALSLNGELGLAFGARGTGGRNAAAAHYEPGRIVINLTKGGGPGSLAHEWLHALDNYFARQDKASGYISERRRDTGPVRDEVYQAWKNVETTLQKGGFAERSAKSDEARSKPYWNTTIEKAARAFERYMVDRLAEKGAVNDYLANIDTSGGAYPTADEMKSLGIKAAFDQLFDAIETKDTERGVALFSMTAWHGSPHQFEQFTTGKIGTGEGAQAYGWGLYFAGKKAVAEYYKKSTSHADFIRKARELYGEFDSPDDAAAALSESADFSPSQRRLLAALEKDDWLGFDYPHQAVTAALREPGSFDLSAETVDALAKLGNLYKVNLTPKDDEWLDWDKPLSQQSPKVQDALRAAGLFDEKTDGGEFAGQKITFAPETGGGLYTSLSKKLGGVTTHGITKATQYTTPHTDEKAASLKLHELGIPGIRYLDEGSRKPPLETMKRRLAMNRADLADLERDPSIAGEQDIGVLKGHLRTNIEILEAEIKDYQSPTHNYVVFDDRHVEIEAVFDARRDLTPKAHAARPQIEQQLTAVVRGIAGPNVRVEFPDRIPIKNEHLDAWGSKGEGRSTAAGVYYPAQHLIRVALADPVYRHVGTTTLHESFHAVENLLLTDTEMAVLKRAEPRLREIAKAYANLTEQQAAEIADFEVRAIAFEAYAHARAKAEPIGRFPSAVRAIMEKLRNLFERVRNALHGLGFKSASDVFSDTLEGKMAGRTPNERAIGPAASMRPTAETVQTADGPREQLVIPGAEKVPDRVLAERQASGPKRSSKPQKGTEDLPLFGDKKNQGELFSMGQGAPQLPLHPKIDPTPEVIAARLEEHNWPRLAAISSALKFGKINTVEVRTKLQDKFVRWKNIQEAAARSTGREIPENLNVYQAESLYYGRTGQRLDALDERHIDPLIEEIKKRDLTLEEVDRFLMARHAPERNEALRKINPDIADPSGMSDEKAKSILDKIDADGKRADFDAIEKRIRALIDETGQTLVKGGLISAKTLKQWKEAYKHYVPLRGWAEGPNAEEGATPGMGVGRGYDIRGKESKQALGRSSVADGPLAYVMLQAQQAVIRAEKNKVGLTALRFVQQHPDPDLWKVDKGDPQRKIDPASGLVVEADDPTWIHRPNVFAAKIDGVPHYINFQGSYGPNLARALKNLGTANMPSALRFIATLTRLQARLATSWNPDFMIPNFVRDAGEAFINMQAQDQKKFVKQFSKHLLPAIQGSFQAIRGKDGGKYAQAFREFDEAGGRIRFFGLENVEDIKANVEAKMRRLNRGAINNMRAAGEKAVSAIEIANGSIENATRLAAYMAARDVGLSKAKAASIARELTVNFNRKGELGATISALYMFANASAQGTVRMMQGLASSKRVRRFAYGIAAAGAAMALYNLGAGGDDDDGEAFYTKIPFWERDTNLIVMWPKGWGHDGKYFKIPLPYGFAFFHVIGARMMTLALKKEPASKAVSAMIGSTVDAFDPLGRDSNRIAQFAPSIVRPAIHLYTNQSWTGRPINPEPLPGKKAEPASSRSFKSASQFSVATAQKINKWTGGTKHEPGLLDWSPGSIDYILGFVTGGLGRFALNTTSTAWGAYQGTEWQPEKTPIVRRFVGGVSPDADRALYFEDREKVMAAHERMTAFAKDGDDAGRKRIEAEQRAELAAYGEFKRADDKRTKLRREVEEIKNDDKLTAAQREQRIKDKQKEELIALGEARAKLKAARSGKAE